MWTTRNRRRIVAEEYVVSDRDTGDIVARFRKLGDAMAWAQTYAYTEVLDYDGWMIEALPGREYVTDDLEVRAYADSIVSDSEYVLFNGDPENVVATGFRSIGDARNAVGKLPKELFDRGWTIMGAQTGIFVDCSKEDAEKNWEVYVRKRKYAKNEAQAIDSKEVRNTPGKL